MVDKYYFVGFFLFFIIFSQPSLAQKKLDRQIKRLEVEADQLYESRLWKEALELYLVLDSASPGNPEYQFRIGVIYYHSVDKARSLDYFLKAVENGKKDPKLNFYLGRAYHFNLRFDTAITYYRKALMAPDSVAGLDQKERFEIEKHIQDCQLAAKYTQDPLLTPISNIGDPINSRFPEYVPLVSADESKLIFTSRRPNTTGNMVDARGIFMEDIYISYKDKNGNWSEPDNNLTFNTPDHDACVGLSPDGNTLILYRSENGGDLYLSWFDGDTWQEPEPISEINTSHWESSACFSYNGQYLYFTSDKPGGLGGSDIYRAKLLSDNKFGQIENLGPEINTRYDEDAPQIHSDGKTLFFSSKGHQGLGGYDIYSTVFDENTGKWEDPRNIGYPINTPDDDIYFTLLSNGTKGYFSSYRNDSYGEKDIYLITRPQSVPTKFLMKFKLYDPYLDRPIHAKITITNKENNESKTITTRDTVNGNYAIPLDFEKDYKLEIDAEGYKFKEKDLQIGYRADIFEYVMNILPRKDEVIVLMDSIDYVNSLREKEESIAELRDIDNTNNQGPLVNGSNNNMSGGSMDQNENETLIIGTESESADSPGKSEIMEFKKKILSSLESMGSDSELKSMIQHNNEVILLTRADTREKVIFPMINFEYNSFELTYDQKLSLLQLADYLKKNQQLHLIIMGHTDSRGSDDYNKRLSDRRALAIKSVILNITDDKERIHSIGMGERFPVMSNQFDFGREMNRRANMIFIDTYDGKYSKAPYDTLASRFNIQINNDENRKMKLLIWEKLPVSVHFPLNHAESITEFSRAKLDFLIDYVNTVPHRLIICGFEDPEKERSDLNLSEKRGRLVYDYLFEKGLPSNKMLVLKRSEMRILYDVRYLPTGIDRQRVQFFIVRD